MSSRTSRYSAVTSTLALLVALGGTSYAATQIGTAQIKNDAVTSPKIKDNTVTGGDVKESSLGLVPTATKAFSADISGHADTATAVNGVTPSGVIFLTSTSVTNQVLFTGKGLTLTASCDVPGFDLDLVATTSKPNSFLSAVGVSDANPTATIAEDFENSSFQPASPVDMLLGDDGDVLQTTFTYSALDGSVVTGILSMDKSTPTCSVRGTVFAS